ncbi:MAG: hypothetical protein LBQ58_07875 [Synergistaceae bacterium]|jgi:hypothetical protein|nr:hypothetical protein [Synergistaceae bacterium]
MIKAELNYNPYLLETSVKFNGHEPKINSLVKQYQSGKLQDWIARLPDIFFNEMNGYDFDLDFSGTRIDFDYLQASFDNAGVSRESVRIFHKNEIKNAERKSAAISDLLEWLENNPNRKFDYVDFRETNADLFDTAYSYIVVQGTFFDIAFDDVTVENVSDINELERAVLKDTPVLFYISEQNYREFSENFTKFLKRGDVRDEQLFFHINPKLNRSQVERVISDLGVECPQIVELPTDDLIKRYLEVYSITDYVHQSVSVLRTTLSKIGAMLQTENEQNISINGALHQKIDILVEIIQKLKNASEKIAQRDNFEVPNGLSAIKNAFIQKIINWRIKKIKITNDAEAYSIAIEFENDIHRFFEEFINQVRAEFHTAIGDIHSNFHSVYLSADFKDNYMANREFHIDLSGYTLPKLAAGLLELKSEKYVEQTDSPFEILKNKLGATSQTEAKELIRVVTYLYQDWRENAATRASQVINEVVVNVSEALKDIYEQTAEDYLNHLKTLIEQQILIKDEKSAQLSNDERKLQADNDWFAMFEEKLREIERD